MQTTRPVFLDLWRIKLPPSGIVSILHRISGVLMVLAIPFAAVLFHLALSGPAGFASAAAVFESWIVKLFLVLLAWSLLHHLFAGIRFLLLDVGIGLDRSVARRSAIIAMVAAVLVLILVIGGGLAQ
ncbi:succinate dehydrogenase, cytochrome b556 subunit [Thiocapsa imhoffii]|uniref:Succinate dehydrogenase cytochrome b556 subunit n=1 Tax=Thiocapsa imhoffii TaxID=382777 RepID=A0A9X0WGS0_9GAMM|nr:succinate dehydrogenase, cytochrome b556 subunit [Thiocapsa imhoffii]MBK1644414.1 succinate dehydrogenase, cytochrome b556 subunit [Thiocapsa imhoffii]